MLNKGRIEMSLKRVKEHLKKYNLEKNILEFATSSATVEQAANAIGCEAREIAKTLSFIVKDNPILIVTAGDVKVDNSKYKQEFGVKAKMLDKEQVEVIVGHAVGGVCPFGINEGVKVYLDASLRRLDVIYPACGSSNSAIKLTLDKLEELTNYPAWIDVCKQIV